MAAALCAAVLAVPPRSPDLFWHLSAGSWIARNLAFPRADPFSFTRGGQAWVDFEWLFQLAIRGVFRAGGLAALWALKAALLGGCLAALDRLLRRRGASALSRAAAAAFWSAAVLPHSDLRADLASLLLFTLLLDRLDEGRFSPARGLALFALWGNLHAGFPAGLSLYAAAAAAAWKRSRRVPGALAAEAAAALLGTLANPYGAGVWAAAAGHAAQGALLSRYVAEWGPPSPRSPWQWGLLAGLAATPPLAWRARGRLPGFLAAAALLWGAAAASSARFGAFFAAAGAAALGAAYPGLSARAAASSAAAAALLCAAPLSRAGWGGPFSDAYVARRAGEFLAREKGALSGLRVFNVYEWGGYLSWRLGPGWKVFGDGRYLFHGQLPEFEAALRAPERLAEFSRERRLDAFLVRNFDSFLPSRRRYPDGSERSLRRPWHAFYFPRERWALAYWDDQALFFVDRSKVPAGWLAAREYRWRRPRDEEALADAQARGEVPEAELEAESRRHARELSELAAAADAAGRAR